ncbi:MAG: hypothetical protein MUD11_00420 [Rhodobacteraceae bacterium]|jgi:hypothetical protein|nr:hypothetical protein [Paracoccaceae bacterium]
MSQEPPNPYRHGPTRAELKFWLLASLAGTGLVIAAFAYRGLPPGPAMVELIGLPMLVFGYLGGRSIKRLIRRQHP